MSANEGNFKLYAVTLLCDFNSDLTLRIGTGSAGTVVTHSSHNPKIGRLNPASGTRGQCFQLFYGRNLRMPIIN